MTIHFTKRGFYISEETMEGMIRKIWADNSIDKHEKIKELLLEDCEKAILLVNKFKTLIIKKT